MIKSNEQRLGTKVYNNKLFLCFSFLSQTVKLSHLPNLRRMYELEIS